MPAIEPSSRTHASPPPTEPITREAGGRQRVLLYSHDGTGLGHIRITLAIARALAERRPDTTLLVLTGSLQTPAYDLPPNLDYVKLPAMPKRRLYEGLPPAPSDLPPPKHIVFIREAVVRATVQAFAPHLIVVDHAPAGLFREMVRALEATRAREPRATLVLLMRDITFGPAQTRRIWREEGVYELLDDLYDRILVYGSQDVFDPIHEYGISPAAAAKLRFCGYLAPPPPPRTATAVRAELGATDRPLAVVTVGGGADGAAVIRAYLQALRREQPDDLVSFVVTGPLLEDREQAELAALATGLPDLTLVPFCPDLVSYLHAADVIVTMGGYNALCEVVAAGKQAIVVPRQPGSEEQVIRAERFAERGLVSVVPPEELSPERLWLAIRESLAHGTSPARHLPFDGARCIVDELTAALAQ